MYGLTRHELRFAVIVSSAHFSQHVFYRVLPPLIPVMAVALEYPLWQLGLLISLYSIGMGVAQAPLGIVSDRVDRRYMLPAGITLTGISYVLFALAPPLASPYGGVELLGHGFEAGFLVMSASMVGVGLGLSVVHPVGYPLITDNVRPGKKGKVLGLFGAMSKVGDGAAPAAIAGLLLVLAWNDIILLFGGMGIVYGVALTLALSDPRYETVPSGQREAPTDDSSTQSGARRRTYVYPMLVMYGFFITSMLATHALNSFFPTFVVDVYGFGFDLFGVTLGPESVANLYFAALLLSGAVMQLALGALADAVDPRHILIGCMAVATVGMVGLAVLELHPVLLVVVIVVLGLGLYGVNPARDAMISDFSPAEREGRTFGYVFTAVTLTGAPLPTLIGYVLDVVGMRGGYLVLAVGPILAAGCIALLYSDRVYRPDLTRDSTLGPAD